VKEGERGPATFRFVVEEDDAGARLDRYLARRFASLGISRTRVRRLIDEGRVGLEGEAPKASRPVAAGDAIEVRLPPPPPPELEPEDIPLVIVHEDDHLIVVDKPAGMVVHPTRGHGSGTLVHALLHRTHLSSVGAPLRPGIVHRLDKGTTGLLVAAKDDPTHLALGELFKARQIDKEYLALAYGKVRPPQGLFQLPIGRSPRDRTKMSVLGERMKEASTAYRVLEEPLDQFSYLSLKLLTGRTHQIRVHAASAGHPLVGDTKYAGQRWKGLPERRLRDLVKGLDRPFLHAHRLAFRHPATGLPVEFTSALPPDLAALLAALRQ